MYPAPQQSTHMHEAELDELNAWRGRVNISSYSHYLKHRHPDITAVISTISHSLSLQIYGYRNMHTEKLKRENAVQLYSAARPKQWHSLTSIKNKTAIEGPTYAWISAPLQLSYE
jgi:hypothetical protein